MKKPARFVIIFCLISVSLIVQSRTIVPKTNAAPPGQSSGGEDYVVQAGDWLTKIADKYYGDPQDYNQIIEATNAKASTDEVYDLITDPDYIEVGQHLWVPTQQAAGTITENDISFKPVEIEALGVRAVVPAVWSFLDSNDPLLAHAWGSGQLSFVSFTSTPGNDVQVGLARILRVGRADLSSEILGGQLSTAQFGDRTWTLYTRDDGGIASVTAATVAEKVIYQISLFAVSAQKDTMLQLILTNFEIIDPTVVQQTIQITSPTPGKELTNPFELRGVANQYPFRGRLVYRVLDAEGNQVGQAPFEVVGQLGRPANFALAGLYNVNVGGAGTIEVAEVSAADGTLIAIDSVAVTLVADPVGYELTIDDPIPYTGVKSPVQIRGKTSERPFEGRLSYRIYDAAGQEISGGVLQSSGVGGEVNLYDGFAEFTITEDGPGRIEVFDIRPADGAIITLGTVNVWLTKPR